MSGHKMGPDLSGLSEKHSQALADIVAVRAQRDELAEALKRAIDALGWIPAESDGPTPKLRDEINAQARRALAKVQP